MPRYGSCGCSTGATPYVRRTYDDGTPRNGSCCKSGSTVQNLGTPNGGYVNECVSSGSTAYCSSYDENGKCTSASSCSGKPYVSAYYENGNPKSGGCCSSSYTLTEFDAPNGGKVGVCHDPFYVAYCASYDRDGKCINGYYSSVACMSYVSHTYDDKTPKTGGCCDDRYAVVPVKISTTENASDGGIVNYCLSSTGTVYCSSYDADGKCASATTSLVKDCKPYRKSATEGACCAGTLKTVPGSSYPVCSNSL